MDSKKKSSTYDLPDEILEDIFHKLPIKTLGLCLCVTKQWSRIIVNPRFIRANEMIKSESNRFSIILNKNSHSFEMYTDNHDKYEFHRYLKLPGRQCEYDQQGTDGGTSVACCNGLMCVGKRDGTIILWNPIIRKVLTLPERRHYNMIPSLQILGLGYDSLTDDYKVIRILQIKRRHSMVEFFSLKTYSWKLVSPRAPYILKICGIACSSGDIHWVNSYNHDSQTILNFNASTEVFREIQLPRILDTNHWVVNLTTHEQFSIALICYSDFIVWEDYQVLDVWVMKEYGDEESWSKIFSLQLNDIDSLGTLRQIQVIMLGLRYEGDMFLRMQGCEFRRIRSFTMSIDTKSGEKKHGELINNDNGLDFHGNFIRYFEENLTLLDNDRAVSICDIYRR